MIEGQGGVIAVTGVGVCCPLGGSAAELWTRIARGDDGHRPVERFVLDGLPGRVASCFDADITAALCTATGQSDPALAFALTAARQALEGHPVDGRTALIFATSAGAADTHDAFDKAQRADDPGAGALLHAGGFSSAAAALCEALGLSGPRMAVSTACASGGHAIALAMELLRASEVDRVLVVASDAVHPSLFAGFFASGALAAGPCAPFGQPDGMSLGEGAGAVLLSRDTGAAAHGVLLGWGGSSDAFHATAPEPRGTGIARSLVSALADAGLDHVDAYNAHGTGTAANDAAEALAVASALGSVPVSSCKAQLGHAQGAAGMLEAIVTWRALAAGAVPPTLRSQPPRRLAPADTVSEGVARPADVRTALSNSSAFGGTNVTLALAASAVPSSRRRQDNGPLCLLGLGAADATTQEERRARAGDRLSELLVGATTRALADAGLGRSADRDAIGLLIGVADGPQQSMRAFVDSRDARGLAGASAQAFSRMVLNAATGEASRALQLRGPSITLWSGAGAGLQAIYAASVVLSGQPQLRHMIAGGADEVGHVTAVRRRVGSTCPGPDVEGAGVVVLGRGRGPVTLVGRALDGPTRLAEALRRASPWTPDRVVLWAEDDEARAVVRAVWPGVPVDDAAEGWAPAAASALGVLRAATLLRLGHAARVVTASASREAGSVVMAWANEEVCG